MALSGAFALDWPGNALFGAGRVDEPGPLLAERGQRRGLVVTDPGQRDAGVPGRVEDTLKTGADAVYVCDRVSPDPTTVNVAETSAMWTKPACDALINAAERIFRGTRGGTIPEGTSEIQTLIAGREIPGLSANT